MMIGFLYLYFSLLLKNFNSNKERERKKKREREKEIIKYFLFPLFFSFYLEITPTII
jgi:hypothetical protein